MKGSKVKLIENILILDQFYSILLFFPPLQSKRSINSCIDYRICVV